MDEGSYSEDIGPEGPFDNYAECFVPPTHRGACALTYSDRQGRHWIILPSRENAITTAIGACRYDIGGYSSVAIYPLGAAPPGAGLYTDGARWLFGDAYDEASDGDNESPAVLDIIKSAMRDLAKRIASHPNELAAIEWRDLERMLSEVFQELGYETKLTRAGKDGGFDLELSTSKHVYLVEVKHWSGSKVGNGIIRRFLGIVASRRAEGLVISTSGFTRNVAKLEAEISASSIYLGDHRKVVSLCQHFSRAQSGLLTSDGLRELFFRDTLSRPLL